MLLNIVNRDNAYRILSYGHMEAVASDEAIQANSEQDTRLYALGMLEECA